MSNTKKRKKQAEVLARANGKPKLTEEQIEAMARIFKSAELSMQEKILLKFYKLTSGFHVSKIARKMYAVNMNRQSKWFKAMCKKEYSEGRLFKDFSGFHTMLITRCEIFDNDWTKFITEDGKCNYASKLIDN